MLLVIERCNSSNWHTIKCLNLNESEFTQRLLAANKEYFRKSLAYISPICFLSGRLCQQFQRHIFSFIKRQTTVSQSLNWKYLCKRSSHPVQFLCTFPVVSLHKSSGKQWLYLHSALKKKNQLLIGHYYFSFVQAVS